MTPELEPITYRNKDGEERVWGMRTPLGQGECDSCGDMTEVRIWSAAKTGRTMAEVRGLALTLCDPCFAAWCDAFANYVLYVGDPPGGWPDLGKPRHTGELPRHRLPQ